MALFQLYLQIYKLCGIWRPTDCSWRLKVFYDTYTVLSIFCVFGLTILEFIEILTNTHNAEDFTNNTFMLLTMMNVCCKIICVMRRRNDIIETMEMLIGGIYYIARDYEEMKIQEKFHKVSRSNTRCFLSISAVNVPLILFSSLLDNLKHRTLPIGAWLPYSLSSWTLILISYLHQCLSITMAAYINVTTDLLINGMIIQICAHFEILKHRLVSMNCKNASNKYNSTILKECIRHHNYIIGLAVNIKREFSVVIVVQLFVSAVVLCSSIFQLLTRTIGSTDFYNFVIYMCGILLQLLHYCWYGNEAMLKSIEIGDAAYNMDWTELSLMERKNLLVIIQRASKPLIFKTAFVIDLSLEAYMSILKVSYSSYNFLQQSSTE